MDLNHLSEGAFRLTLEQVGFLQEQGAKKSPQQVWQEQEDGEAGFCLIRQVWSVPFAVMLGDYPFINNDNFWREYGSWKLKDGVWKFSHREYPFPAESLRPGENPQQAVRRGLIEELGIYEHEGVKEYIALSKTPIFAVKKSHTAGFLTLYTFYPYQVILKREVVPHSSENLEELNLPEKPSDHLVWRIDKGKDKKVLCFRRESFPDDWETRLRTI